MSEPIDHRVEGERALANAARAADSSKPHLEATFLQYALVHFTAASGTPVVDQHMFEALTIARQNLDRALRGYGELQTAVRELIDSSEPQPGRDSVLVHGPRLDRLHALIGGGAS